MLLASRERLPFRTPGYVPHLGLANAPIVETKFLELVLSLLDFSPRIPLGTFSILLVTYVLTSSIVPRLGVFVIRLCHLSFIFSFNWQVLKINHSFKFLIGACSKLYTTLLNNLTFIILEDDKSLHLSLIEHVARNYKLSNRQIAI